MGKRKRGKQTKSCSDSSTTVKMCLKKHLKQHRMIGVIDDWVKHISKISHRGSMIFNHLLLWCFEKDSMQGDDKYITRLFDQIYNRTRKVTDEEKEEGIQEETVKTNGGEKTFFRTCFLMGEKRRSNAIKFDILDEFWQEKGNKYPPIQRRKEGDIQVLYYSADQYATNFQNYMFYTIGQKQTRYIKEWGKLNGISSEKEIQDIRSKVNGWSFPPKTRVLERQDIMDFIREQTEAIGWDNDLSLSWKRDKIKKNSDQKKWMQLHMPNLLEFFFLVLRFLEIHDVSDRYTIAPIFQIRKQFIRVDVVGLFYIMDQSGLLQYSRGGKSKCLKKLTEQKHKRFLYLRKKGTNLRKKGTVDSIQTDGVALCVTFKKIMHHETDSGNTTRKKRKTRECDVSSRRIIAIDPGRNVLICGVEQIPGQEKPKQYRYTRRQYYHESHINQNNAKLEKWRQGITEESNDMARVSAKTSRLDHYERYIDTVVRLRETLFEHNCQNKFARLRMDNYIHKHKAIDKFFKKMKGNGSDQNPIIAYGDASFGCTGRGEKSVPVKWIKGRCQNSFEVTAVDEYRTTKCCNRCHQELYDLKRKQINKNAILADEVSVVRGLKWCRSTTCILAKPYGIKSHDINAAAVL